jgi:predicted outer membrane repeat protein
MLLASACGRLGFDENAVDGGGDPPTIDAGPTANNRLTLGELTVGDIVEDGFSASVAFSGDDNENAVVTLRYCNFTDNPDCDPSDSGFVMTRNGSRFVLDATGLLAPDDPGDILSLAVFGSDPDGVFGSPVASAVELAFSGCLVDSPRDIGDLAIDGVCNTGVALEEECTLRAALAEAEVGNCVGGILISSGLTIAMDSALGEFDVGFDTVISGQGRNTVVLDAGNQHRVMRVGVGVTATIRSLTIANGSTTGVGGGLLVDVATVDIDSVNFVGNTATAGGSPAYGGGLGVAGTSTVTVTGSRFIGNVVSGDKGGGGIGVRDGATIEIFDSVFENNSAPTGGAIYTQSAGMQVDRSLFVNNDTTATGGGQWVGAVDIGCGATGSFTFRNSTFTGNDGVTTGAIFVCPVVTVDVLFSTFADNGPSDLHHFVPGITTTLTANAFGSLDEVAPDVDFCSGEAGFASGGGNVWLAADADCGALSAGDLTAAPQLLVLADNGGNIPTMALSNSSLAIDHAGFLASCPAVDQRGYTRPAGAGCDSGAFEANALPPGP